MNRTTSLTLAALTCTLFVCACEREPAPPAPVAADPDAMYTVNLPRGFTQTFDADAPADYGELRLGELVIVENRTGDRIKAGFHRYIPMSAVGDSFGLPQYITVASRGLITGPALDLAATSSVNASFAAVADTSWGGLAEWQPDPWGRRFVVEHDESGQLRMTTSLFIPPQELQQPVSIPCDWAYDPDAGSPEAFRLVVDDRVVIENALGHHIKAILEFEYGSAGSAAMIAALPSRGVAKWKTRHSPLWMKVAFLQVPMLNDPAASTPTRAFESRVSDEGLTVRFARDEHGELTTDFHQGVER
jgi:hypothetical protein